MSFIKYDAFGAVPDHLSDLTSPHTLDTDWLDLDPSGIQYCLSNFATIRVLLNKTLDVAAVREPSAARITALDCTPYAYHRRPGLSAQPAHPVQAVLVRTAPLSFRVGVLLMMARSSSPESPPAEHCRVFAVLRQQRRPQLLLLPAQGALRLHPGLLSYGRTPVPFEGEHTRPRVLR